MIKPSTFSGMKNFTSSLYAAEIMSRFADPQKADGYYNNYGDELDAEVNGSNIVIHSGAIVVQGRLTEIVNTESVAVTDMANGQYGYLIARIETYKPTDQNHFSFIVKTGSSLAGIPLTQEVTYGPGAEEEVNRIYELPIYSFRKLNNSIAIVEKLIKPIEEVKTAIDKVNAAKEITERAEQTTEECRAIASGRTAVRRNGVLLADYEVKNVLSTDDTVVFDGGGA